MTKVWLGWIGRGLFTAGALWFLANKLNWREFGQIVRGADGLWVGMAFLAYGCVVIISIVRWHLLLEVAGVAVGWGRTAQLSLAGLFFNSVLPGVMGGDVMRAYWAAKDAPLARPAAVVSILLGKEFAELAAQPVKLIADEGEFDSIEASLRMRMEISETEKVQLVKSRRGQGLFKANVLLVESACRVTGVTQVSMLRASHVKPWSKSDDREKIDGFNGLLLAPHVDHLFDKGHITFESKGAMVLSPILDTEILDRWGIPQVLNVGSFSSEQSEYLNYHQDSVFLAS